MRKKIEKYLVDYAVAWFVCMEDGIAATVLQRLLLCCLSLLSRVRAQGSRIKEKGGGRKSESSIEIASR